MKAAIVTVFLLTGALLSGQASNTVDPDFGIIAPEYGSPIFAPNSLDPTGADFTVIRLKDNARVPSDWLIQSDMAFFPTQDGINDDPSPGFRYIATRVRIDNSDGAIDLQSDSVQGLDGGKKNWWGFMLMLRSDPKSGRLPKVIWFAEQGPSNFNELGGNQKMIVRSGESLLLNIVWEVPVGIPLGDIAVQYADVNGAYTNNIRLDRVRSSQ